MFDWHTSFFESHPVGVDNAGSAAELLNGHILLYVLISFLSLQTDKNKNNFIQEVYEGKTYEPAVGMSEVHDRELTEIPPPPPTPGPVSIEPRHIVVFDLETTGLSKFSLTPKHIRFPTNGVTNR